MHYYILNTPDVLWIPILVEPNQNLRVPIFIDIIYSLEVTFIVLGFAYFWMFAKVVVATAVVHRNLGNILALELVYYYGAALSRIVLLAYQLNILRVEGEPMSDLPLLLAAMGRLFYAGFGLSLLPLTLLERIFSTLFVADYERRRRRWITVLVFFIAHACGVVMVATVMAKVACWKVFVLVVLIVCIGTIVGFAVLFAVNKQRYKRLSNTLQMADHYTLSLRFQLIENIRSMKLISLFAVVLAGLFVFAALLMGTGFMFKELVGGHVSFVISCYAIFDFIIAFFPHVMIAVAIHRVRRWRNALCEFGGKRSLNFARIVDAQQPRNFVDVAYDSQTYFDQLRKSWS